MGQVNIIAILIPLALMNLELLVKTQTAVGKREYDGTGVRDYIHVVDLAIDYLNLGYSVLDVVKVYEKASAKKIPYKLVNRRIADPIYAKEVLNWEAKKTIKDMCEDSWRWQSNNPDGYSK